MATEKQIIANRKNALKSTGPQSELGKRISSRNSIRHGFYATCVVLPDEDQKEFICFARRLISAYAPCGTLEEEQVRTIIETRWQLRRANLVDTELFQIFGFYEGEQRGVGTAFAHDAAQANAFSKLARYESFHLRKLQIAEKELARLKSPSCASHSELNPKEEGQELARISESPKPSETARNDTAAQKALKWLKGT